jgi:hypothetical protein
VFRRYAVANDLGLFVTGTFAVAVSEQEARDEARAFMSRLRASAFDGTRFPYLIVCEEGDR